MRSLPSIGALLVSRRPFVLLEDRLVPGAPARLYHDPVEIVRCDDAANVPLALERLEAARMRGLHAAGFLAYELGYAFEQRLTALLPEERALPLLWFGLFAEPLAVPSAQLDEEFGALAPPPPLEGVRPALDASEHAAKVGRVLDYLHAGDAYQVNLTFPVDFRYGGDPLSLYAALRASQPVSHGGIVAFDDATILSVSPELFLDVSAGRVTTRPMKGTTARRKKPQADRAAMAQLQADPKQRAENLMIVDLLRNDLGRISTLGSVEVPSLFQVETYPTLHTLTSTVTSELHPGLPLAELVGAVFPCGSITGAPKLRAMEIIRELEPEPRDAYTGSIGAMAPNGDLRFNVAIRTATLFSDGTGRYGIGGGIVADSEAASEYEESLLKARVLTDLAEDYGLIETFRWSTGTGFVRIERHLDRLERSARTLGFRFDRRDAVARLDTLAATFGDDDGDRRIRLELRRDGVLDIASPLLGAEESHLLTAILAQGPVDAGDPFLRHKTTRRRLYENALAVAMGQGAEEAILANRAGFVTEATRSNVFVERNGILLTPPRTEGVLPGVLRQCLIESGEAIEQRLRLDDISAEGLFLGNSLRGLRRARLLNCPCVNPPAALGDKTSLKSWG